MCCQERNITNCHQCKTFPCYKFKRFAKSWLKYEQDLISNQHLLKDSGVEDFLKYYNSMLQSGAAERIEHGFYIRKATVSDIPELKKLYKNTVLSINRKDYSAEEVKDWASCGDNIPHWRELFIEQHYFIAENETREIVGFASINDTGYIHTMFVHKDFQHQGIASLLYHTLEQYAEIKDLEKITSEVSITARPFFEKQGFRVDKKQKRKANQLYLTNYKMSKRLKV